MQGSKGIIRRLDAQEPEARPLSKLINGQAARCSRPGRGAREREEEKAHPRLAGVLGAHPHRKPDTTSSILAMAYHLERLTLLWKRLDPPES